MCILLVTTDRSKAFNWGHSLFLGEVLKQAGGIAYGPGYPGWSPERTSIPEVICWMGERPELILSFMGKYSRWAEGMSKIDIPKVHIIVDYFPWCYGEENSFLKKADISLSLANFQHEVRALRGRGFTAEHLPLSISHSAFPDLGLERDLDVTCILSVVNYAYPTRAAVLQTVARLPYKVFARNSTPSNRVWREEYVELINRSKIFVNAVDSCHSLNFKFFEACAGGALLLTEKAEGMKEAGFLDGENCVVYSGVQELSKKIRFFLSNEEERIRIAKNGRDLVLSKHTDQIRVQEMLSTLSVHIPMRKATHESVL